MRAVFGLVLIVGVGLAGFAVYMAQGYLQETENALAAERAAAAQIVPTVDVYAVNRSVAYGEELTMEDVAVIKYVETAMPDGLFLTEEELFPQGPDVRRVVLRPMEPNEPVMAIKVTEPGEDAGITSRLSRGMRAFAIRVDVSTGVSGFLRPGDRVDVYWTGRSVTNSGDVEEVTKLIQSNVKLIAIDQTADGSAMNTTIARTVTVEATPQVVASLAQAQSTGRLSLSLVGTDDDTIAEAVEVDQRSLLGIPERQQVVEAEPEQVCTIKTRRGAEVVEIPIPCTN
ncbi:Flp pilus assembly protein CpaB [Pelagovum pacificum]|uniref:Flp pilus assembly protein CpaB n=1 Tax=Pelagovum pacificum TaxID=2588711 RepID=A0A5C5G8P5_9RHOB|nr:Flp pilus assembly protein CpaB [Pelagovum pacificum]QQA41643.1 Flp pilus assembly protein CpaB [Pelagovum pacificum]TNY30921.1 Flp pilus assembly protein CpaB [Pelagovum pacificum]